MSFLSFQTLFQRDTISTQRINSDSFKATQGENAQKHNQSICLYKEKVLKTHTDAENHNEQNEGREDLKRQRERGEGELGRDGGYRE